MSSTSLPSRGLPGKLYQLTLSSLVGSFRSGNPRIPPSCRDFFTLQGHFGELTFFQFLSLIIKVEIRKLRNVPTFSGVQLVDQIQEMFDQPTSRHRPSIQLMTKPSIFSISPVVFCFEKQRISMDFPKKNRCFFCWHNFNRPFLRLRFGSHEGGRLRSRRRPTEMADDSGSDVSEDENHAKQSLR